MKFEKVKLLASIAGVALLAACSGGGDDGANGETGDLIPGGIASDAAAGDVFLGRVQELANLIEFTPDGSDLPSTGTADFAGTGLIVDTNIPQDVDTVSEALEYALVATLATAKIDFSNGDIEARQFDFRDVADNVVDGEVLYEGTLVNGTTGDEATAIGSIAGTSISATGEADAGMAAFAVNNGTRVTGFFEAEGSGGKYPGVELGGAFAADN